MGKRLTVPLLRRAVSPGKTTASNDGNMAYRLQLIAEVEGEPLRDSQSFIGLARGAQEGRDSLDFSEAPPLGAFVRLSIVEDGERYAGNFKPTDGAGQFWDLEVDASLSNKKVHIRMLSTGQLPENYELFILDRDKRSLIEVSDSTFQLDLGRSGEARKLRLLVGTGGYAEQHREGIPLIPLDFKLGQNFPNPFSASTTIRYEISEESSVQLEIFNLMGQRVQVLVDRVKEPGSYEIQWDGMSERGVPFASGIYLYRIRAGQFTEVRKMLLVR